MEILQLKYFMYAAKKENISHAAKLFSVPPSSVSASIKKLEREMGVKLFDRGANKLRLSAAGKILLRSLEAAAREMDAAKTDILNLSKMPVGEIKLLILTNRAIVTDTIAAFKMLYPGVSLTIKHQNYDGTASIEDFDVIITDTLFESSAFVRRDFVKEEVFLGVHNNSDIARLGSVNLKNLKDEKFVCMPKGSSIRDFMDKSFKKAGFEPEIAIECDEPHYISEYVKMGLGVTFFPSFSWRGEIDGRIKLVRINEGMYRTSYIYLSRNCSKGARIFAETLEKKIMDN